MRSENEKYCHQCGLTIAKKAEICPKCGVRQPGFSRTDYSGHRDLNEKWILSLLLCWFLGVFGVHRFYLNKIGTGVLMLLTFGGLGIWYLIDLIFIAAGQFKDEYGQKIGYWKYGG